MKANNRYYSNAYGRFMTPDPFTSSGRPSEPQSWNRYAYALGDPTNLSDPSGLEPQTVCYLDSEGGFYCQQSDAYFCYAINGVVDPECGINLGLPNQTVARRRPSVLPPLMGSDYNAAKNALTNAKNWAQNNPGCDSALQDYGIPSIAGLLSSVVINSNVYDGRWSTATASDGGTTMNYLSSHPNTGATASLGTASDPGDIFLGNPFFNPDLVGVTNSFFLQAQMLLMMHEAVHSIGDKMDSAFDPNGDSVQGSVNLTHLLVTNCFPAIQSGLGRLGF